MMKTTTTMKGKIMPVLQRFVKSAKLQRGGGWRAARVGVVGVVVVVVWAWVFLVPSPAHAPPTLTRDDWSSRFPNLQVAAPIGDLRRAPPHRRSVEGGKGHERKAADTRVEKKNTIDKINPVKAENEGRRRGGGIIIKGGIKGEEKPESKRTNISEVEKGKEGNPRYNRIRGKHPGLGKFGEDRLFPKMFPKRRLVLPGETELLAEEEEEEEDVYEEEGEAEGKGRDMDENDKNHAMEEMDEAVEVDDNNTNNDNNNIIVQDDVGGEAMKQKRQTRDKPQKKTRNDNRNNSGRQNEVNLQQSPRDDLKENGKPGHKSHKEGNNDLPHIDLVAVEEEMRVRRSRVRQVCARYGLGPHAPPGAKRKVKYPPTPAYESFYVDRGDRLAWCPVYKAASTSWLYGFLGLAGISESYVKNTKEQVSTMARRVWPALPYDEAKEALTTCVKAMVVRHPFERLASAFRDKLEKVAGGEAHGTYHFYQKYGRKIVEKYRRKDDGTQRNRESYQGNSGGIPPPLRYSNALADHDPHQPPPPPPRYKHVLDDSPPQIPDPHQPPPPRYKHVVDDSPPQIPDHHLDDPHQPPPQRYKHILVDEPAPPQPSPQPKEPTFSEFVQYLIDTDLALYADDHWMPYHLSCTPCLLDFDVIAKFETLDRDQAYLLRKTNLGSKLHFSWHHLTKGNRTKDVVKRYFAEVPKKDLLSLYGKYKLDFEMFDYSVDEYLTYVMP